MTDFIATERYRFTVKSTIKVAGIRFSRIESHAATGAVLNEIVEQEGAGVITSADLIEEAEGADAVAST